jgi:predicted phosphodiesterase
MAKELLFGICADVHHTESKNEAWRVKKFVEEANERKADFIIQLGDFILPDASGRALLDEWDKFNGDKYHVLGNHDSEHGGKEQVMQFQGQKAKYYSFDAGDYHSIVLDTNYAKNSG